MIVSAWKGRAKVHVSREYGQILTAVISAVASTHLSRCLKLDVQPHARIVAMTNGLTHVAARHGARPEL